MAQLGNGWIPVGRTRTAPQGAQDFGGLPHEGFGAGEDVGDTFAGLGRGCESFGTGPRSAGKGRGSVTLMTVQAMLRGGRSLQLRCTLRDRSGYAGLPDQQRAERLDWYDAVALMQHSSHAILTVDDLCEL